MGIDELSKMCSCGTIFHLQPRRPEEIFYDAGLLLTFPFFFFFLLMFLVFVFSRRYRKERDKERGGGAAEGHWKGEARSRGVFLRVL